MRVTWKRKLLQRKNEGAIADDRFRRAPRGTRTSRNDDGAAARAAGRGARPGDERDGARRAARRVLPHCGESCKTRDGHSLDRRRTAEGQAANSKRDGKSARRTRCAPAREITRRLQQTVGRIGEKNFYRTRSKNPRD